MAVFFTWTEDHKCLSVDCTSHETYLMAFIFPLSEEQIFTEKGGMPPTQLLARNAAPWWSLWPQKKVWDVQWAKEEKHSNLEEACPEGGATF